MPWVHYVPVNWKLASSWLDLDLSIRGKKILFINKFINQIITRRWSFKKNGMYRGNFHNECIPVLKIYS